MDDKLGHQARSKTTGKGQLLCVRILKGPVVIEGNLLAVGKFRNIYTKTVKYPQQNTFLFTASPCS